MEILIIVFLIILNGVFSMSEIALVSSRKFKLESSAKKGNKGARTALDLAGNPNTFLSTVQIGITLIGILTGIFSGAKITDEIQQFLLTIPALQPYAGSLSVVLVVIIITYFSVVFGELVPKRLGLVFPEKIASFLAPPMRLISRITKPFIWILSRTSDLIFRLFGIKENKGEAASEEEITSLIHESTISGEIQEIEHHIVKRVFALGDRKVRELMTHRTEIVWFDIHDSLETIKQKARIDTHSVYPVADKELDHLIGVVPFSEIMLCDSNNFRLQDFVKKPLYVHENLAAYDLLEQFKTHKVHSAIIVDEYGSVEGMITMYNVFEALVGERVEALSEDYEIVKRDENSWLVDGQYSYYELLHYFNLEEEEDVSFTTLGGLILHLLHHIPEVGERVAWKNFEFEIVDMDSRRIDKVLITRIPDGELTR